MDTFFNQMLMIAAPKIYWLLLAFLLMMVVVFPFISLFIMSKNKIISSYSIPNRKERLPVLFFMITYYSMTYYIFRHWNETLLNLLDPYVSFLFATILLLVCLFLITTTWKISLHSSSIAGLCGGIMAEVVAINEVNNSNTIMIINTLLLVLMGLVCFARIYLKAHTFLQVIAGLSLGFSLMFVVVYFQWSI
jgi:membrane-associated phospholipid phosphatase